MNSIKEIFKVGFGPSSSHTIGPTRAAEIFFNKYKDCFKYDVTLFGSLAATGVGHGTDIAIKKTIKSENVNIFFKEDIFLPLHPNGMIFEGFDKDNNLIKRWEVYSIGGGDLKDNGDLIVESKKIYELSNLFDILTWCKNEGKSLWEYVEFHEDKDIWDYLHYVWSVMKQSIKQGIENEGVLPGKLKLGRKASAYNAKANNGRGVINDIGLLFSYALAVSEENAAGGKVVTAPTCGSSGVIPSVLYFLDTEQKFTTNKILKGLATAGLIGNIIKKNASISGAEVGCQGEVGSASAMAAAAATQIMGGTPNQIEYAAEMGIEHNLGLTCDPILGYVQIPCIERNAIAAGKAVQCAVYALFSDGRHKITFDMAVKTMGETGKDLQASYRETGWGGLAKHFIDLL